MSNVPGIINLTSSVLPNLASYPVRSVIFIARINLQLALNDYMTHVEPIDLSIFRTRFSPSRKVGPDDQNGFERRALNRKLVTCKSLIAYELWERLRSVT